MIDWFKNIKNKRNKKFIQIDVVNFYPSISEKLLKEALEWAKQFTDISEEEIDVILKSKDSILFNEGEPWGKKGGDNFDIAQGSYDGAECAELVGMFILADINSTDTLNPGIYRDDFLAVTSANPQQTENLKKQIVAKFSRYGLGTTATANLKKVDFLDVTLALDDDEYKPYHKPNSLPQYVNNLSNHPPSVLRNIPANINKRLSSISSSEKMFEQAAPIYQEAIKKSGYDFQLKFDPTAGQNKPQKRLRKRKVLWFNPPYNSTVSTPIGELFLKLLDAVAPKTENAPLKTSA